MRTLPDAYRAKASGDQVSPIEIYDVFLDSQTLHLAKYDVNFSFYDLDGNTQIYTAFPISREPAEKGSDMSTGGVTVKVANVDRSMSAYVADNDFRGRRIVIRKVFTDLVSSSGDACLIFDGVMDGPAVNEDVLEFRAVDRLTLGKEVPRQRFQLLCNHKFGNPECFYGRTSGDMYGTVAGTIGSGSTVSRVVTSGITGSSYFKDGEVRFSSGSNANKLRKVLSGNTTTYFDVDYSLDYAPSNGDTYTIRRNCDKTWFRCSGDFANDLNFFGFPTIPAEMVIR